LPVVTDSSSRRDYRGSYVNQYARPELETAPIEGKFVVGISYGFGHRGGWSGDSHRFEFDLSTTTVEQFVAAVRDRFSPNKMKPEHIYTSSFGLAPDEQPKLLRDSAAAMALNGKHLDIWNGWND